MSGKARQAKWHEKVKKDKDSCEAYRRKYKDRKAAQRSAARSKMTKEQEQEYLMQERSHIQEYHVKKKLMSCEGLDLSATPYRTTQAKGRQLNVYKMLYQFHQERDDVLLSH